jgi:peptidoglycan/xylan/chitin deacetylase (PgdA/CDA1 family)
MAEHSEVLIMLRRSLKEVCLQTGESLGLFGLSSKSSLRNSRVLVLCYHGIALKDEHLWAPALFVSPAQFRRHMEALRRNRCTVLTLDDALTGIANGDLPERATVLTFDDGTYDFYKIAWPILEEFGYPATLYLPTYYVDDQHPMLPGIWNYLLWQKRGSTFDASELFGKHLVFDLSDEAGRTAAQEQIQSFAKTEKLSGHQRHELSAKLAQLLQVDFDPVCSGRILHPLTPQEIQQLAQDSVSIQMHTHHHSNRTERQPYLDEVRLNRERIREFTGLEPSHFCYPHGIYSQDAVGWLRDCGVRSATICDPGMFAAGQNPLLIPRLLVQSSISDLEFDAWLVGIGDLLNRVRRPGIFS